MKLKKKIKNKLKCVIKAKKLDLDDKKKIYIILAADYGNLGDVAITYAQKQYLNDILPEYEVIEIPASEFYNYYLFLKNKVNNEDIITIVGGGNLGNLYDIIEDVRRKTIKTFKNNLIVSFPQTATFTEDIKGEKDLEKAKKIYSKHKKLILFAREEKTYNYMKKNFEKNEVYLTPDIVFYLKNKVPINDYDGNKVGVCFRDDVEKLISENIEKEIRKELKDTDIKEISTHIGDENIIFEKKYNQLLELIDKIRNVKVLITDRLHGMIFAYITETPCIAIDNKNHKIKETYKKWLKDCNYIKLLDSNDFKNIKKYIDEVVTAQKSSIDLNDKFKVIEDAIKNTRR